MTTIITRHYPASKLPEELREGINPSSLVTVTIVQRTTSSLEAGAKPDQAEGPVQLSDHTHERVGVNLHRPRDARDE